MPPAIGLIGAATIGVDGPLAGTSAVEARSSRDEDRPILCGWANAEIPVRDNARESNGLDGFAERPIRRASAATGCRSRVCRRDMRVRIPFCHSAAG